MERAKANAEAREVLERNWPRAGDAPLRPGESVLFLVSAHDPRANASVKVLITDKSAVNAERSVREHLGNHWAGVHATPICHTFNEVFRQI